MDADQALAAVFVLNDSDLSSLSGDSSDISADSTDLWLSSDSSSDEDGDSDDTLKGGAVANRLRRRTSDQMVLGSNPAVAAALSPWTRLFTPIVPRRSLHISFY